jgi:hypothetical protein
MMSSGSSSSNDASTSSASTQGPLAKRPKEEAAATAAAAATEELVEIGAVITIADDSPPPGTSRDSDFRVPYPVAAVRRRLDDDDSVEAVSAHCSNMKWHRQPYRQGNGQCRHRRLSHWRLCVLPTLLGMWSPQKLFEAENFDVLSSVCVETPFPVRKTYPRDHETEIKHLLAIHFDLDHAMNSAASVRQIEGIQLLMDIKEYAQTARNRLHAVLVLTYPYLRKHNDQLTGQEEAYMKILRNRLEDEFNDPRPKLVHRVALYHFLRQETFNRGVVQYPMI